MDKRKSGSATTSSRKMQRIYPGSIASFAG